MPCHTMQVRICGNTSTVTGNHNRLLYKIRTFKKIYTKQVIIDFWDQCVHSTNVDTLTHFLVCAPVERGEL